MKNLIAESVRLGVRYQRYLAEKPELRAAIAAEQELSAFRLSRCAALQRRICRATGGMRSL